MDAQGARLQISQTQNAFKILSLLQLTAYLYPPQATVRNESTFDFAIIGGGTAGSVVARRLAEDGKTNVLLIEAGGDPPLEAEIPSLLNILQNSSTDWNYTATTGKAKNINCQKSYFDLAIGKMLGGSSACNYILYAEGNSQDYNNWAAAVKDPSWNKSNVLPYFIKSQNLRSCEIENSPDGKYFGYNGPIIVTKDNTLIARNLLQGFVELGYPIITNKNIDTPTGYTTAMFNLGEGRKQHTAYSYLRAIRKYPNLYVLKNTLATKLIFDKQKRAVAVRVVTKDNKFYIFNVCKEIIVSAGTVNTPKLLMLSGVGPEEHLKTLNIKLISDLPVGKNFRDPTSVTIVHELSGAPIEMEPKNPHEYPASVVTGLVSLNNSKHTADYETVSFFNYQKDYLIFSTLTYGYSDIITNSFFELCKEQTLKGIGTGNAYLFTILTNLYPKSKGEVLLKSANYNDPPLVRSEHNSDPQDVYNNIRYIKDFIRVTNTKAFKKYKAVMLYPPVSACMKSAKKEYDYWKCYISCFTNSRRSYVGTCAMGSVVDKHLYVKGVKGLRVVDASVIPNSLSVAPFASVVMLAEKASDMIKQTHGL